MNGYILKNFRKDFKMTQKDLAEKAGLGLDKIKKLETGKNKLMHENKQILFYKFKHFLLIV